MTPDAVASHLARIGYRFEHAAAGEGTGVVLEPRDRRLRRIVRRIHLWQHDAQSLRYAIDFAPIRAVQVLGMTFCAAGIAIAFLAPTFWCVWLFATALLQLVVPEAMLAVARHATREALEWAVRCPSLPVVRREHPAVSFPQVARNS